MEGLFVVAEKSVPYSNFIFMTLKFEWQMDLLLFVCGNE